MYRAKAYPRILPVIVQALLVSAWWLMLVLLDRDGFRATDIVNCRVFGLGLVNLVARLQQDDREHVQNKLTGAASYPGRPPGGTWVADALVFGLFGRLHAPRSRRYGPRSQGRSASLPGILPYW